VLVTTVHAVDGDLQQAILYSLRTGRADDAALFAISARRAPGSCARAVAAAGVRATACTS